jgi:Fur family peroxide stress response transcriptional regulator
MSTAEFLRSKGIQPSHQRIRIYETLAETKAHPSAEQIFTSLSLELATLSRTTVYSTLELFAERGVAFKLTLAGTEFRWDGDVSAHGHFHCRACEAVIDLGPTARNPVPVLPAGARAEAMQVSVSGLCGRCAGSAPS